MEIGSRQARTIIRNRERSQKMRVFIAIQLSTDVKVKLKEALERLRETGADVRCVKPENAHLTLRFLGKITESDAEKIKRAMEKALQGICVFKVSFGGAGAFPKTGAPRVVWTSIREGEEKLCRIRNLLEETLSQAGIERENREYHPHLTLARVKSHRAGDKLASWIESNNNLDLGSIEVSRVTLMESTLTRNGSKYRPLATVNLVSDESSAKGIF